MQITYFTKNESVYICQNESGETVWYKRDKNDLFQPLAGAIHLPRTRLQELLREYPRSALDSTVCFGNALAKEFFEDAAREHINDVPEGAETNIFFLVRKGDDKFIIGFSSTIDHIEIKQKSERPEKV